jgi:hypothetical protein
VNRDALDRIFMWACFAFFTLNLFARDYDHAQLFLSLAILLTVGRIRSDLREKADR